MTMGGGSSVSSYSNREGETSSLLSVLKDSQSHDVNTDETPMRSYCSLTYSDEDNNEQFQSEQKERAVGSSSKSSLLHCNAFLFSTAITLVMAFAIAIHHHNTSQFIVNSLKATNHQTYYNEAYSTITNEPLSYKSPQDLNIPIYNNRPQFSRPESVFGSVQAGSQVGVPLPTNEWYLNLVVGLDDNPGSNNLYENYASDANRVYTIPYILDVVGTIVGIRLHYPNVLSYGTVVQSNFVPQHGLTLGTANDGFTRRYKVDEKTLPSKLGVGLRWDNGDNQNQYIRSSILRGMPYGTMEYGKGVMPTIASEIVAYAPIVDGSTQLECGTLDSFDKDKYSLNAASVLVKEDLELYFPESDLTWLVFFSRPVNVRCYINPNKGAWIPPGAESINENPNAFQLRVDHIHDDDMSIDTTDYEPLIVRVALANNCTYGSNVNFCNQNQARDQSTFMSVLRKHSSVYPTSPTVKYAFTDPEGGLSPETPDSKSAYLFFDWAAKSFDDSKADEELLMFALPHHVDILTNEVVGHCIRSLHGNACLVKGGLWAMEEVLGGLPSFSSPRPPNHRAIPALAQSLSKDINYALPDNYMKGAGDTYFSGKMLAKLGRIIVVAQELRGLASTPDYDLPGDEDVLRIIRACKEASLPTEKEVMDAVGRLRSGVEVWLNGSAAALFTYDNTWGGLVSCGCWFNGEGCDNAYPNCPTYQDPGLNFGNGMYNDHHFHYGYYIYAAAILAEFDRDWGRQYFERVMFMIRDIANPSIKDVYFPVFRQKDWFLGNSWASGIALFGGRPYSNGRNQESSSEAIAAYEGVAMYGSTMMKAWGNGRSANASDNDNAYTACQLFNIGRFLATTEIRSADRYWHVYSPKRDQIYPDSYTPAVVSMMWDTMAQSQTWFGNAPFLAYGIQLLPLTPISERRDTDQWLRTLYPTFVESCMSDSLCENEGWSVLLYAVLAELGHEDKAMENVLALPNSVFESAGGGGHSLTNTLWYIASRPTPKVPYNLTNPSTSIHSKSAPMTEEEKIDCGCPDTCVSEVLSSNANGYTCAARIQWLITNRGLSELGACKIVAGNENKDTCGACDPALCAAAETSEFEDNEEPKTTSVCPPCTAKVCNSDLNRCQVSNAPFLCTKGDASGGCSPTPWEDHCSTCCELFVGCGE